MAIVVMDVRLDALGHVQDVRLLVMLPIVTVLVIIAVKLLARELAIGLVLAAAAVAFTLRKKEC